MYIPLKAAGKMEVRVSVRALAPCTAGSRGVRVIVGVRVLRVQVRVEIKRAGR